MNKILKLIAVVSAVMLFFASCEKKEMTETAASDNANGEMQAKADGEAPVLKFSSKDLDGKISRADAEKIRAAIPAEKLVGFAQRRSRHGMLLALGALMQPAPWRAMARTLGYPDAQAGALAGTVIDLASVSPQPVSNGAFLAALWPHLQPMAWLPGVRAQRLLREVLAETDRSGSAHRYAFDVLVVDEAQELGTMAWRALARRCPVRSFTAFLKRTTSSCRSSAVNSVSELMPLARLRSSIISSKGSISSLDSGFIPSTTSPYICTNRR